MKRIKSLFPLLVLSFFFSCEKENVELAKKEENVELVTARLDGTPQSFPVTYNFTLSNGQNRTVTQNILYRLFKPNVNGSENLPLIITMGGGGFVELSYNGIQPNGNIAGLPFLTEQELNDNGIAYMQINYYLIKNGVDGVYRSLYSAEAAIEYVIAHADAFGIDPDRIIVLGASAGASTSLWLGLTRDGGVTEHIKGIVAINAQSSLNIAQWSNTFNSYGVLPVFNNNIMNILNGTLVPTNVNGTVVNLPYLNSLYKEPGRNFFSPAIAQVSQAHDLDFLSEMDADDPEIYLMNNSGPNDILHHLVHSMKIRDASNSLNRPVTIGDVMQPRIQAQESLISFCKRKFGI